MFGPVLIASLGLRWPVSGNICSPYSRASSGFALMPEKSGVWADTPRAASWPPASLLFSCNYYSPMHYNNLH